MRTEHCHWAYNKVREMVKSSRVVLLFYIKVICILAIATTRCLFLHGQLDHCPVTRHLPQVAQGITQNACNTYVSSSGLKSGRCYHAQAMSWPIGGLLGSSQA